jgi:hypothetical protein
MAVGGELGDGMVGTCSAGCWALGSSLHSPVDLSHVLPAAHPMATQPCKNRQHECKGQAVCSWVCSCPPPPAP